MPNSLPIVLLLRKIDALAAFENLAATAESRWNLLSRTKTLSSRPKTLRNPCHRTIRLWDLTTSASLVSWVATKTYIR